MLKRFKAIGAACAMASLSGLFLMGSATAYAAESPSQAVAPETAVCKGLVIDEAGDPVIGATVLVKGTTNATATNLDGEFSLKNVPVGSTIRVSYIGCTPEEVVWTGGDLEITLHEDSNVLDEVVVVGFGTQKKVNLTGSVSTISASEISNRPVNSVVDAMQGLVPGLDVLGSSLGGQINGTRTMNIRGTGTIGSGSNVVPLVLIDGMEGDLNTIQPSDVENISILKDASASSIYGSRAAGGVILVTTKKGKAGRVTVNYSDNFRFSKATRMPHMMDSYTFANYMQTGSTNNGSAWLTQEKIDQIKAAQENPNMQTMFANGNNRWEVWDVIPLLPIGNTDWLYEHFGKTAFSQEHNVSITGGTEKVNAYFSANYLGQEGVLRYGDDNINRYIVNGKINAQVFDWFNFGYSSRFYRNKYDAPSLVGNKASNQFYHDVQRYWPMLPVKDPNGHYLRESYIPALTEGGRYVDIEDIFDMQFTFLLTPIKGLNVHADFNYRNYNNKTHRDYLDTYSYNVDDQPYKDNAAAMPGQSSVTEWYTRQNYFNPNIYGDFSFSINEAHNFKVMAGYQSEWLHQTSISASRTNIINDIPYLDTTSGTPTVGGSASAWSTAGVFGRLNYDYKGRYLVEGNLRYDGTSRFRSDRRWSWSPSFSLGWNIAQEAFWEDYSTVCQLLKLRFSWGKLGNQNTSSWYPTYATMGYYTSAGGWLINNQQPTYATQPSLVASSLTWEKNRTWDIGLDWGFLNNRLTGSFDYYNRKTMDMVGPAPELPDVLGTGVPRVNNLDMTSKGWELTIAWRDRINEFFYGVSFNLYDHQITIDRYPNDSKNLASYYPGAKLGDIWGYTTVGIAKTDAEMEAHLAKVNQSSLGSGWRAGDIMYADLDGDGKISRGENTANDHGDIKVIGNSTPRYQFGLTLDAQWRGFDLKAFFQGTMKRDYWAGGSVFWGCIGFNQWQANALTPHLDYFRDDPKDPLGLNLDSYYPRPNWGGGRNTQTQTRYLQNAAYCRLKNLTLGYTIPKHITQKAYVENLRVFFSGENIFTITNFTKTGDPELVDAYGSAYGYGKVYPLQKVFSFGLNVTF